MWGRNRMAGTAATDPDAFSDATQWIEIYNHGAALKSADDRSIFFFTKRQDGSCLARCFYC